MTIASGTATEQKQAKLTKSSEADVRDEASLKLLKRFEMSRGSRKKRQSLLLLNQVTRAPDGDHKVMLKHIKEGFPVSVIEMLEKAFGVPRKDIAHIIDVNITTLRRRMKEGRLEADESDRVARLARIRDQAVALMQGDEAAAIVWLKTPQEILGGETPMHHSSTELGARDVEDLIGRIRHGVFS